MLATEAYAVTQGEGLDELIVAVYLFKERELADTHANRIEGRVRGIKGMQGKKLYQMFRKNPQGWKPRPY